MNDSVRNTQVRAEWVGINMTRAAASLIILFLALILGNLIWHGHDALSFRFILTGSENKLFKPESSGVLPMIVGTASRVILMSVFVIPIGVITAIYLAEYAPKHSKTIRWVRLAINNLAGVPAIVFGLFGLGFFVHFVGGGLDTLFHPNADASVWKKPAIIWASLTLAVMTLPVMIVTTEEAIKSVPIGLREASLALGISKFQTTLRIVIPHALPGILTGAILSISRAAGEVAPILFTGAAYYMSGYPQSLNDQFMDLGYHILVLSTSSSNIDATKPFLFATVLILLLLTFSLNIVTVLVRAKLRRNTQISN